MKHEESSHSTATDTRKKNSFSFLRRITKSFTYCTWHYLYCGHQTHSLSQIGHNSSSGVTVCGPLRSLAALTRTASLTKNNRGKRVGRGLPPKIRQFPILQSPRSQPTKSQTGEHPVHASYWLYLLVPIQYISTLVGRTGHIHHSSRAGATQHPLSLSLPSFHS
jgi:hypothetical protein